MNRGDLVPSPAAAAADAGLLARLNIVALERRAMGQFKPLGAAPEWFERLFADVRETGGEFRLASDVSFLGNFLVDAETFWVARKAEVPRSGIWCEEDAHHNEHYFEASALSVESRELLLIEQLGTRYREKQATMQEARNRALQLEARRRSQNLVQQARDRLRQCLADCSADLEAARRALKEQSGKRQQAEDQLDHLPRDAALTGLPNRALFEDQLAQALGAGRRLAVMFVLFESWRTICDALGHRAGDVVLQQAVERVLSCLRATDSVARYANDEFALLLTPIGRREEVEEISAKLQRAFEQPIHYQGHDLWLTPSIGVTLHPFDAEPELLKQAATAFNRAVAEDDHILRLYRPGISVRARERLVLESHLRRAMERNEFSVYFQPRVESQSNLIVGMEALIRWSHPEKGLISPVEFIPLAEETGLLMQLGRWVLRAACAEAKRLLDVGFDIHLSVNVAPQQFERPGLVSIVEDVLRETGFPPRSLELEITEASVVRNPDASAATMHELRRMGVTVALDDFGSGYSSLGYLKRFPIDVLKIDRFFIQDAVVAAPDAAILTTIVTLAHTLGLGTVAEGVETEDQATLLRSIDCEQMQGFLFGGPLTAPQFEDRLRAQIRQRRT